MKTTLRAKLLQHLAGKKKTDEGFTLIELLVVIIIIGILAAIALPSFLNQANKAKQTEAATNIGAINRGQQAYVLEFDEFSKNLSGLGIGIRYESERYGFGSEETFATANIDQTQGINTAGSLATPGSTTDSDYALGAAVYGTQTPANVNKLKGYTGVAYLLSDSTTGETTSTVLLIERTTAGNAPVLDTITTNGATPPLIAEIESSEGRIK